MGTNTDIQVCFICQTEKQICRTVHQLLKPESNPYSSKKAFKLRLKVWLWLTPLSTFESGLPDRIKTWGSLEITLFSCLQLFPVLFYPFSFLVGGFRWRGSTELCHCHRLGRSSLRLYNKLGFTSQAWSLVLVLHLFNFFWDTRSIQTEKMRTVGTVLLRP